MERCVSCRFYDRNQRGVEAKSANGGQCRKAAPALSPINQKTYMIEGVWPTVRDDDWCGEWKVLQLRADTSRLNDVLNGAPPNGVPASMPVAMPPPMPLSMPPSMPLPPSAAAFSPAPRLTAQAARAALSAFSIDSRPAGLSPSSIGGTLGD